MSKLDTIVFIGRFQPFHNGHLEVIRTALSKAKKVLVLVGSSNQPRTPKNPFTFEERRNMIYRSVGDEFVNAVIALVLELMCYHCVIRNTATKCGRLTFK